MTQSAFQTDWKRLGRFEVQLADLESDRRREFGLSPREWQTLKRIAAGNTTPEIAIELNIQPSTVDTFKRRIFEKLEVNSAAEASSLAIAILSGVNIRERPAWDEFDC